MIQFPHAKINLGLHVTGRRSDGYHELETVFYPLGVHDALELVPAETTRMQVSGMPVEGENLCLKAYHLLKQDFDLPSVDIYLHKCIPMGAGLGGGSSDAAFFLRMLNTSAGLELSDTVLDDYARDLGADCPFFLKSKPMLARGIGDDLSPIALDLSAYHIQLIYPGFPISTAEAYKEVQVRTPVQSLDAVLARPIQQWRDTLVNDFETGVFLAFPQLKEIKKRLYAKGALYAAMSGSGSSVFGIFKKDTAWPVWEGEDFSRYQVFNLTGKLQDNL